MVGIRTAIERPTTNVVSHVQIHDRVTNLHARDSILRLRQAIKIAEQEVPGLMNVFISEIVDSVEASHESHVAGRSSR